MGILDRFSDIAKANINDLIDDCEDQERAIDRYLADLIEALVEVKREAADVLAEEARTKRLVDDNNASVERFARLARKAVEAGNDDDARVFLAKKRELESDGAELAALYGTAHANADRMRQMHDKLVDDIEDLKGRREVLEAKLAVAQTQSRLNGFAPGAEAAAQAMGAFDALEARADDLLDRADSAAELAARPMDAAAALERKYASAGVDAGVEAELADLKSALGR